MVIKSTVSDIILTFNYDTHTMDMDTQADGNAFSEESPKYAKNGHHPHHPQKSRFHRALSYALKITAIKEEYISRQQEKLEYRFMASKSLHWQMFSSVLNQIIPTKMRIAATIAFPG